ncbi:DUF6641 family protein [Colwellia piezophila]|uniref:DUF6641 family protein n=1 Tax=Colwellia piezophila TaxID=211668 RepID=UPI0003A0C282|nr:DUF6641 family protein [Colwellia piezophila]
MAKSIIGSLKLSVKQVEKNVDPIVRKQNKLIKNLREQRLMAEFLIKGKQYVSYKEKAVIDEQTGEKTTLQIPKKVRAWFFEVDSTFFIEVKYSNVAFKLGSKSETAIEVGDKKQLPVVIDKLIEATEQGEFTTNFEAFSKTKK